MPVRERRARKPGKTPRPRLKMLPLSKHSRLVLKMEMTPDSLPSLQKSLAQQISFLISA
jgi:hypothetical protein